MFVVCAAVPPRVKLKKAISHAKNLCFNYEDTPECHKAWEKVYELELADEQEQKKKKKDNNEDDPGLRRPT